MNYEILDSALKYIRHECGTFQPMLGIILGSGWSEVAAAFEKVGETGYEKIPGLGEPGVAGHAGRLVLGRAHGLNVMIFQGRRHWYEGDGWTPIALPIYALRNIGASCVLLTNAAGGIRGGFKAGELMILDDHINAMGVNPLLGRHHPIWGPRFPDQTRVYDPHLRELLSCAAKSVGEKIHHGIYLAAGGPTYETPAEIQAYHRMGADAVGMSTVPEAILANACGMLVAGLSCITNLAAGISKTPLSHEEVTQATREAMPRMKALVS